MHDLTIPELISRCEELHHSLGKMYNAYSGESNRITSALGDLKQRVLNKSGFDIGLVGLYSTGKTTLLKALFHDYGLARVDLPTESIITTQIPTVVRLVPDGAPVQDKCVVSMLSRSEYMKGFLWGLTKLCSRIASRLQVPQEDLVVPSQEDDLEVWIRDSLKPFLGRYLGSNNQQASASKVEELLGAATFARELPAVAKEEEKGYVDALAVISDPAKARGVKLVIFSLPAVGLKHEIRLVDLPGADAPIAAHQYYTYDFIERRADAIIFLKSVDKPSLTDLEKELLLHLKDHLHTSSNQAASSQKGYLMLVYNKFFDLDVTAAAQAEIQAVCNVAGVDESQCYKVSALISLMHLHAKEDASRAEEYFLKKGLNITWSKFLQLSSDVGPARIEDLVGISKLRKDLLEYSQEILPGIAKRRACSRVSAVLDAMRTIVSGIQLQDEPIAIGDASEVSLYEDAYKSFRENLRQVEERLVRFIGDLGVVSVLGTTEALKQMPRSEGFLGKSFRKLSFVTSDVSDGNAEQEDMSVEPESGATSSPDEIMRKLVDDVFPGIDLRAMTISIETERKGRAFVHSHELELDVIRRTNNQIRDEFLRILKEATLLKLETLREEEEFQKAVIEVDAAVVEGDVLRFSFKKEFDLFMDQLALKLSESCDSVAELAIRQLDVVGRYSNDLAAVAKMECKDQRDSDEKKAALTRFLQKQYKVLLEQAFDKLRDDGAKLVAQVVAAAIEEKFGESSFRPQVAADAKKRRVAAEFDGKKIPTSVFEAIDQAIHAQLISSKESANKKVQAGLGERQRERSAVLADIDTLQSKLSAS